MIGSQIGCAQLRSIADAPAAIRHVFVRDLVLHCSIGVHQHEHEALQRIRVNLDLAVREGETIGQLDDELANVVCYEKLTKGVQLGGDGGGSFDKQIEKLFINFYIPVTVLLRISKI